MSIYYIIIVDRGTDCIDVIRTVSRKLYDELIEILKWAKPIGLFIRGFPVDYGLLHLPKPIRKWTGKEFMSELSSES